MIIMIIYSVFKLYSLFSQVNRKSIKVSHFPSDNLPVIVGGTVGASVIVAIGVILAMAVARYDNEKKICAKKEEKKPKRKQLHIYASL